ncbi:MAG TPA: hypothetical protein DGG22_04825 [Ruminococcaceae bacterium]|nr:hypothetical protein [Oscillospiraceae bacterium]
MKKLICIIMSAIIIIMLFMPSFTICAADTNESKKITEFTNGIADLARKYDSGKEFVAPEEDETAQIQAFSARNSEEVTDSTETEYTLQDFQTARLIIRADGNFDKCGALEDVSGFEDFHILQYESPETAMDAYNELLTRQNVIEVEPDLIQKMGSFESEKSNKPIAYSRLPKHLTPWSLQRTQADRLLNYLETNNVSMRNITVAVIDSGLDYNHEFLKERVDRTYFNSSPDGLSDDEMDIEIYHGTAVSSVIVDNTPENIRIKGYKALSNDVYGSTSGVAAAILQAVNDKVDVINLSITFTSNISLSVSALETAFASNISVVCASGNSGMIETLFAPANIDGCITVGGVSRNSTMLDYSVRCWNVDVSAPGQEIVVAKANDEYEISEGTSFASPCVAALAAIIRSIYPDLTYKQIENHIKKTTVPIKNIYNYVSHLDGTGIVQFCNALDIPNIEGVITNLTEYKYESSPVCILNCADEDAKILFTGDGTYPDISTATEYTAPFLIDEFAQIRAVAYYPDTGYYSEETEFTVRVRTLGNEDDFIITDNGVITKYTGNDVDLIVPDIINGITVTGIQRGAFDNSQIYGLTLPKTITEIPSYAFNKHQTLSYIEGQGILSINSGALYGAEQLLEADFPNVITIGQSAFSMTHNLLYCKFDKLEKIDSQAFDDSGIIEFYGPSVKVVNGNAFNECDYLEILYLPNWENIEKSSPGKFSGLLYKTLALNVADFPRLEAIKGSMFKYSRVGKVSLPSVTKIEMSTLADCYDLEYIYMPNLITVPKKAFANSGNNTIIHTTYILDNAKEIKENAFQKSYANRLEFSHLEKSESFPLYFKDSRYPFCIISLPSTFKECTEDTKGRNYTVYGTKGTYAEQWANENGHTFVEISQDTAVLTPLPEKYTDADGVLTADVIGFNRTYQWYGSFTADNTAGTPIDGATDKDFNPIDYPAYPYYYCVVTSTDVGYDPIEIHTNVTENTTYQAADYTEYNKAVEQANAIDRSLYQDLTALDEALSADISGLSNAQQNIVDEQTAKIKAALDNIVLKPADYSRVNEQINTVPEHLEYYTDKTVNALNEILNGIDYGLDITKQEVIDSYAEQLQNAISALEYKPADYTEYDKAVSEANGLDKEKYVDFSQVEKELSVDVGGRNITQQEEVDLQTKAILAAIDALEEKPQEQPIINPEQDKTNGNTTPDKPSKNESVISPMTGSETYTGVFTALAALSFATVLLVRKKKDN